MIIKFMFLFTGFNIGCVSEQRHQQLQKVDQRLSESILHLKALEMSAHKWRDLMQEHNADVPIGVARTERTR